MLTTTSTILSNSANTLLFFPVVCGVVKMRAQPRRSRRCICLSWCTENQSSKLHGDQFHTKSRCCTQGHRSNASLKRSKLQSHSKGHTTQRRWSDTSIYLEEHLWRWCWINFRQTTFSMLTAATIKVELPSFSMHQAYALHLQENYIIPWSWIVHCKLNAYILIASDFQMAYSDRTDRLSLLFFDSRCQYST